MLMALKCSGYFISSPIFVDSPALSMSVVLNRRIVELPGSSLGLVGKAQKKAIRTTVTIKTNINL
jgi:hypothetical protein